MHLHDFFLRNGFSDTNVYRSYNDITMTIMMMGLGTFVMQDWDDIINELRQHWTWEDRRNKYEERVIIVDGYAKLSTFIPKRSLGFLSAVWQ